MMDNSASIIRTWKDEYRKADVRQSVDQESLILHQFLPIRTDNTFSCGSRFDLVFPIKQHHYHLSHIDISSLKLSLC